MNLDFRVKYIYECVVYFDYSVLIFRMYYCLGLVGFVMYFIMIIV